MTGAAPRPTVSIILAVFNEESCIKASLESLLRQDNPDFDLEILVVDGVSSDGTRTIVQQLAETDRRVRLLENPKRKAPFAFNIGIHAATGEYVCILGAHTVYDENYVSVCLDELLSHEATGCSGQLTTCPANDTLQARLSAWIMSHRFGSSGRSVRTQTPGFVQTIPYPIFRKHALLQVGGYDERLYRNQDNDMNERLRSRGHRLYLTALTHCQYFAKPTLRKLITYGFKSGYWNYVSWRQNPHSMAVRHFVPFVFVVSVLLSAILAVVGVVATSSPAAYTFPLVFIVGLHLLAGALSSAQIAYKERSPSPLLLPPIFLGFHLSYGAGTLWAVLQDGKNSETLIERERCAST